ncbi:hypothetical protein P8452_59451 [Trifolium repens]|nr:hypothetical protein P8452_59451 [Trifolium repens]
MVGVSSRTRSKNIPLFSSLSLNRSSSKRKKSDEDVLSLESVSGSKRRKLKDESFVLPKKDEVICFYDDDSDEEGLEHCDVNVKKEVKSYENGDKNGNFVDDEKCGWERENPIIMDSDDEDFVGSEADDEGDDVRKEVKVDESGGSGKFVDKNEVFIDVDDSDESDEDGEDSDESDENESSDEDFNVDEVKEISDHDDDSSSDSSFVDDVDDKEEEEEEEKKKKDWRKHLNGKYFNVVEKLAREVNDEKSEEEEEEEKKKKVSKKYFNRDEEKEKKKKNVNEISDFDNGEEKKGLRIPNNAEEEDKEDNLDPLWHEYNKCLMEEEEQQLREVKDKKRGVSNNEKKKKDLDNSDKQKKMESNAFNQRGQRAKNADFTTKDLSLVKLLAECFSDKKNSMKNDPVLSEGYSDNDNDDDDDDVNQCDTRKPPVCVETPLIWSLKKVQEVELTEEEEDERRKNESLKPIWDEMEMLTNKSEAESKIGNLGTNEATQEKNGSPSSCCEHDIIYGEEIGNYCISCGTVITESKYKTQLVRDSFPNEGYEKRASSDDSGNASLISCSQSQFNASDGDLDANFCHKKGTVWDLIPEVKETLYPHQQEGFEVIWKNLAGSIKLRKLKNVDPDRVGGCIISHAPGTGKTRLTIVFLMAYLKVFPKCFPVIIAPSGLLHTWEDEFKKWNIGVPFHNLNNEELSGKEHDDAVNELNWSNAQHSKEDTRMVKLISWYKETSILGISYTLYKELAGAVQSENKKMKNQASAQKRKEMGKSLREVPGLLVLDEGHTPRNRSSGIWKVFSEISTKKRIILSGTPFQNNCLELYNTLSLVKPSFPNMLPQELKRFCQKQEHKKASSKEWSWEPVSVSSKTSDDYIQQLKMRMDPIVHVHKGDILQKKLPGLKNCVLRLKPDSFHQQILENFDSSQNALIFENNQTMVSVHPSLFLECTLSEHEESSVDKDRLEKLRLNHKAGVKTRFLVEFVSLCAAANEKVLVFSQYLRPLHLIIEQLKSALKWTEDEEIMYMDGQVKDRQSLIRRFNDSNSQAKILLASTKACSEGISLVGASRVVLLDVEWNPAVEKQAISRAYRIGQQKVVYTYHLLTQGTRECDKYCKQIEKYRLSELIFSAKNADINDKSKSRASNIEDRILDKMIRHENLKDLFDDCVIQVEGARM